jgi:Tol biopolymer transport system component
LKSNIEPWLVGILFCAPISAQVTQRVSLSTGGTQANTYCLGPPSSSADGRYVAFLTGASNLVSGDTNGFHDVFVRDRQSGTTERVSVDSAGIQGNNRSAQPSISPDGRYVVFASGANNLAPGDTNDWFDVFVHDRQGSTTERVSIGASGTQGNNESYACSISADGRYVAFDSVATNLVPGDTNGRKDIFIRDRQTGTTNLVSVATNGTQGNDDSYRPLISADGRYIAFGSLAATHVPGDTNGTEDIFVRDLQSGITERVSVGSGGAQADSYSLNASISADGCFVAFRSAATNLVPGDTGGWEDIFLRDRQSGTTERVSVATGGEPGNESSFWSSISADGRFVAFDSWATNLAAGYTSGWNDVFVRDRQNGTTEQASVASDGTAGDSWSAYAWISADGRYVVYPSISSNLDPGDTNGFADIFLRDREGSPDFASLCDPGVGGVIGCPCSNPPSGTGRGCNNSSGTGGAVLAATGGAYLSSDSLVFTTTGERPTALTIVTQWTGSNPTGVVFGMGVRCTSGTLKRLYTRNASGGIITAPDFGVGDPQVSVRSAALGDTILAGQSRWYLVYYRDPNVLGGCPASSTFNATQTGEVTWSP